ncbi:hypothetical protein Bbelb_099840 [Branchiostoma belcheri]|nr:hypothetical protein Bbelb_099840 [Branchiostoma belcheri]
MAGSGYLLACREQLESVSPAWLVGGIQFPPSFHCSTGVGFPPLVRGLVRGAAPDVLWHSCGFYVSCRPLAVELEALTGSLGCVLPVSEAHCAGVGHQKSTLGRGENRIVGSLCAVTTGRSAADRRRDLGVGNGKQYRTDRSAIPALREAQSCCLPGPETSLIDVCWVHNPLGVSATPVYTLHWQEKANTGPIWNLQGTVSAFCSTPRAGYRPVGLSLNGRSGRLGLLYGTKATHLRRNYLSARGPTP